MNKAINDEDADAIREICNIIGPTLEQAVLNGVFAFPQHEAMERILWGNVYASSIGRNGDPNDAQEAADRAVRRYNGRFPK